MSEQEAGKKESSAKRQVKNRLESKTSAPSLNMSEIRELAELVNEHGFTDFEFENENIRVRLSKTPAAQIVQNVQQTPMSVASSPSSGASGAAIKAESKPETPHPGAKAEQDAAADEDLYKIPSPIVGTFYRSPSPDKEPYVKVGSKVTPDSTVCIVEAMKLMNEIPAETTGEVVKIYVENGQAVEYGQPLFGIKK